MKIAAGAVRAFYLFDVADTINLAALRTVEGEGFTPADIPLRPHQSSGSLQFPTPPLVARFAEGKLGELSYSLRAKFFDYGVISLRFDFPFAGAWEDLEEIASRHTPQRGTACSGERKPSRASATSSTTRSTIATRRSIEDYLIIEVDRFEPRLDAELLLHDHSEALANILLGESGSLSQGEIEESLRTRFSYYADDLTIVQWDTAFVYDRRESSDAIADILEFANSQLLELRTYDALLDRELDTIYAEQPGQRARSVLGRREADLAANVRYLIVDVLELIDRSSNALKVVGDAYYARIYRAAGARLGLADWQRQIDSKLASVGDIYRFFIDQARGRRDDFLEVIVILLIAIEVVIGVVTLVRH